MEKQNQKNQPKTTKSKNRQTISKCPDILSSGHFLYNEQKGIKMFNHNPIVVANWKMNTTLADALVLATSIKKSLEQVSDVQVIIAPPAVYLYPLAEHFFTHPLKHLHMACQNINQETEGAYTGEISALMVKKLAQYVFIGHSERVAFGETPQISNQKVRTALETGLKPILFIRESQRHYDVKEILQSLDILLNRVSQQDRENIIFVYEPSWAISTAKEVHVPSAFEIEQVIYGLKKELGKETKILYGGSVTQKNINEIIHTEHVDGVVVGSASLSMRDFLPIIQTVAGRNDFKNNL